MSSQNQIEMENYTTFKVISALRSDDLDSFADLIKTDSIPTTNLANNNNLLQLSIIHNSLKIFKFLLTNNCCCLDHLNNSEESALELALTQFDENDQFISEEFSINLIEKGANVKQLDTFLHLSTRRHFLRTTKLLIEHGCDINYQDENGCTPLHTLFDIKTDPEGITEGVGLLLYFNADTSICDDNGNNCFELAICYDPEIITAQRNLFLYSFDANFKYKMSSEILFELLDTESPLFLEIYDYISDVEFLKNVLFRPSLFFKIDTKFLQILIEKFDYVIKKAFYNYYHWYYDAKISLRNWEMLLHSHLARDTIEFIMKLKIDLIVTSLIEKNTPIRDIFQFITYLLSYGLTVSEKDLELVYKINGYCDLFKVLLHMEIQSNYCDLIPKIIFDIKFNLDDCIETSHHYPLDSLKELLCLFSRPKLKQLCYNNSEDLKIKVEQLPAVSSLLELSRDAFRKYLIDKCHIESNQKFFTMLNALPISKVYKKIVSYETKLYY